MTRLLPALVLPLLLLSGCASSPEAETPLETAARPDSGATRAGAPDPPAAALVAELPFLDGPERRIHLDLAPEGHSRRLPVLLDTGAQFSVFSPRAARQAGVRVRRVKRRPYRRSTRLGRDLSFYVDTRSSDQGTQMGWEYGLLGGNFLEHYVVELDFAGRTVRFFDPDRFRIPGSVSAPDEAVLPLRVVGRRPMVEVSVNGLELPVLVDTGAPMGLVVSGEVADRAGIRTDPARRASGEMILGPVDLRPAEAERLALGPFALEAEPVLVAPRGLYNWAGPTDSLVGYEVLARFVVRLDYPRRRMWLKRLPRRNPPPSAAEPAGDDATAPPGG